MTATSLLSHLGAGTLITASTTLFLPVGVARIFAATTEANSYHTQRAAGVFSGMNCYIKSNTSVALATTVTFRKNTADGSQTFSIGAGATGEFSDTTNSDMVAAGDEVSYEMTNSDVVGGPSVHYVHCLFAATTDTYTPLMARNNAALTAASATNFFPLGAQINFAAVEANTALKSRAAGTLQHLYVYVSANARKGNSRAGSQARPKASW